MGMSFKKKNQSPSYINNDYKWEKGNLKETESSLKQGAKWDKDKSESGWTNPKTGQKFSAEHYKENYKEDVKALQRIKDEQKKRKLSKSIKERDEKITKDIKMKKRDKTDSYMEQ